MSKVIIDYENFKDVLREYLAEHLIDEIISCMNDNDVFIENIDEETSGNENNEAFYTLLTTEEAIREVEKSKYKKPIILSDEMIVAMRENHKSMKEVKHK